MGKLFITQKFGIIPINLLNNKNISLKAKGLYAFLQSKPDGWKFSIKRIALQLKESEDTIRKIVKELEKNGYLSRHQNKIKGQWGDIDYFLREKPVSEKPVSEKPVSEKPVSEKPVSEKPVSEKPVTGENNNNSKIDNSKIDNSKIDNNKTLPFNPLEKEPTHREIKEYADIIGYPISSEEIDIFLNHYKATGWTKTSGIKIIDWRPLLKLWHLRNNNKKINKSNNEKGYWDKILEKAGLSS